MKLPKNETHEFEIAPAGNHLAVCYMVVDLGTQTISWEGQQKEQHKIQIAWELPNERMGDGRPFIISNRYTFSTYDRAKFRQHLESWRGVPFQDSDFGEDGFDVKNIIGKGCLLNLIHNAKGDKTYCNIASIAALPKGTATPELENDSVYFDLQNPDHNVFDQLSEWLQETISKSPEFKLLTAKAPADTDPNSEIPF